mgnify:CR=1 FL=1
MPQLPLHDPNYRRDMGDGLLLRWAVPGDVEGIAALYSEVFRDKDDPPNAGIAAWTHDLMSGRHPHIVANDFALVEDTRSGTILAATCLLRQSWEYAGIAFPVGRPEIVASMPGYRERGLVRAVFDLIHARSDAEGHMAQGITGFSYIAVPHGDDWLLGAALLMCSSLLLFNFSIRLRPAPEK